MVQTLIIYVFTISPAKCDFIVCMPNTIWQQTGWGEGRLRESPGEQFCDIPPCTQTGWARRGGLTENPEISHHAPKLAECARTNIQLIRYSV